MPLLVCCLFAWTAPYLLLFLANLALQAAHLPFHNDAVLFWAASAWFVVLAAIAIRTLFGTSYAHGLGASCAGWLAGTAGLWLYGMFGNVTAYLASPFVLYYLYVGLGSQLTGIGSGLRARQRFKRQLEIATMNPRDADAHCQLGLDDRSAANTSRPPTASAKPSRPIPTKPKRTFNSAASRASKAATPKPSRNSTPRYTSMTNTLRAKPGVNSATASSSAATLLARSKPSTPTRSAASTTPKAWCGAAARSSL